MSFLEIKMLDLLQQNHQRAQVSSTNVGHPLGWVHILVSHGDCADHHHWQ